jgi:hypothetical protein
MSIIKKKSYDVLLVQFTNVNLKHTSIHGAVDDKYGVLLHFILFNLLSYKYCNYTCHPFSVVHRNPLDWRPCYGV